MYKYDRSVIFWVNYSFQHKAEKLFFMLLIFFKDYLNCNIAKKQLFDQKLI